MACSSSRSLARRSISSRSIACARSSLSTPWRLNTRTSTIVPVTRVTGTIVEVRVFNRHGVDKDERAQAIEREEIERLAKDRDDEQAILDRNTYARLADVLSGKIGLAGPKGFKRDTVLTRDILNEYPRSQWWAFAVLDDKV